MLRLPFGIEDFGRWRIFCVCHDPSLLHNRAFICLHKKPSPAGAAEGCVKDKLKFITSCAGRLFDAGQLMIGRASLSVRLLKLAWPVAANVSRGSVSLGAWFGFAFLATVLCELCGKEELNREERQGFAKDAKQVLSPKGQTEPLSSQVNPSALGKVSHL